MADPFSAIGCVLGILTSLITISQPVIKIVDNIRKAPREIQCISRDIRAFFSIVRSLGITLREQDIRDIVESDRAISDQICNLEEPLRNCRDVLTDLMVKHEGFEQKGALRGFRKLRWAIFTKDEVRSIQSSLEPMKSTLNSALNAVTILVSIRILAMGRSSAASATRNSEEQVLDTVTSLVYQAHLSNISHNREPCQQEQIARIFRTLGERRVQMQQLGITHTHAQQSSHDSSTVDVLLDFVSRFSVNGPNLSIDRLRAMISGRPDSWLETSPSICPEQFDTAFPDKMMCVSAILPLTSHPRLQRYFVTFQEKTRRWQRVIVVATFDNFKDSSAMLQDSREANSTLGYKVIPKRLKSPLRSLLGDIEDFGSVTNVFVHFKENDNGQIAADMTRVQKAENMLERQMSDENKILQDIEHLGCPQFKESQVIYKARLSCYRYKVWVGDRDCTERKIPFASAGLQGDNQFSDFGDEVKRLMCLRGCRGIAQILGVILEDTGRHIKGYLYEAPLVPNLKLLIGQANKHSKPIPWAVRELWIGQIVAAMCNVHARGLVIGALNIKRISIKADGTAVVDLSDRAHRKLPAQRDRLPPELQRMNINTCRAPSSTPLNFQTDVFQLGFLIWLIAEHRADSWGYYCTRAVCTAVPRYQCTASHADPTELPPCSVGIPSYIDDIITASRLPNPKNRPSAWWLSTLFPSIDAESQQSVVDKFLKDAEIDYSAGWGIFCNECGDFTTGVHYHCYICDSDDFDICRSCYEQGIRCWIEQHHMVKMNVEWEGVTEVD